MGTTYVPDENGQLGSTLGGTAPSSTGLFSYSFTYGIQTCTDGTSNTVAFAEALVGAPPFSPVPGNGVGGSGGSPGWGYLGNPPVTDVYGNVAQVMADLQGCNAAWQSAPDIYNTRGYLWAMGSIGFTMFNTDRPAQLDAIPMERVWFHRFRERWCSELAQRRQRAELRQRLQQSPGRCQCHVRRRQRQVHQGSRSA